MAGQRAVRALWVGRGGGWGRGGAAHAREERGSEGGSEAGGGRVRGLGSQEGRGREDGQGLGCGDALGTCQAV